jgi:hypothetical protein
LGIFSLVLVYCVKKSLATLIKIRQNGAKRSDPTK